VGAEEQFHELAFYTLAHADPCFIHQHVVDAFAAQNASESDKPIKVAFALIGLYLHVENGCTGREVQAAHVRLARDKRAWPRFSLPGARGAITAADVIAAAPGSDRDRMIEAWCRSVWEAFAESHEMVAQLVPREAPHDP